MTGRIERIEADVWALRTKLAETVESATRVAGHHSDWTRLGVEAHMPPEMTKIRLDHVQNELQALARAALDASLAIECLRAQLKAEHEEAA